MTRNFWTAIFALPLLSSFPAMAVPNSVTIKETSGSAQANRPFTISRVFAQGEIPHFAQAVIGGTAQTTQCDVKTRWPDGSVKHALISFQASLSASGSLTVSFVDQPSGNNTGAMTQAQMVAANWGAEIDITSSGPNCTGGSTATCAANAQAMLAAGSWQYWLQGPVCTQIIVEDRSQALAYDMGWDAYKPLHPIFVVTFYPGSSAGVKVEMILENMWTTKLEDQAYSVALRTGNPVGSPVYSKSSFTHVAKTRWRKTYWSGSQPGAINIDFNLPYMISTQVVPNWDYLSKTVSSSTISGDVNAFNSSDHCDLGGHGLWTQFLPQTGGRPDIGTFPVWYVHYLYTFDPNMFNVVVGQAACAGYIPNHLRESATGKFFDSGHTVNAFGHPISLDARPTIYTDLSRTDLISPGDLITPVGTTTTGGWTDDIAHEPGWNFIPYLVTGDWYLLEELYFHASRDLISPAPGFADYQRGNSWGYFNWAIQTRGQGWGLRDTAHAAFAAPDGLPEQAYYTEKLNNNIAINEGFQNVLNGNYPPSNAACPGYAAGPTANKWCFGRVTVGHNFSNPLHFTNAGGNFTGFCSPADPHFVPASDPEACFTGDQPWMYGYKYNVLGHIQELGFGFGPLNNAEFLHLLHMIVDPNFNPYLVGVYNTPVQRASTSTYYQTYTDLLNAYSTAWSDGCGHTYNLRTVTLWTENCGGGGDANVSAPGYPHIMKGASSYLAGLGINDGSLSGVAAWNWMVANVGYQGAVGVNPQYAILPRAATLGTAVSQCDLNSDGVVDVQDVQISINKALGLLSCGNGDLVGTGTCNVVDTQRVINAALGGSCRLGP